ncbi:hypothetical protein [Parasphingopyxis marina]|uniref:Uncharacterized protein n=1 Tax=Parasphingopyxis marina TaxID=2761622 RepID=A0A842HXX8_9SPHN|nr:hypothetical protein [Parasphingopyxis marina]MBC2776354.1 hypothetical protein [Parasphingopyxis marina]
MSSWKAKLFFALVAGIELGHSKPMRQNIILVVFGIFIVFLLSPDAAHADSWVPPTERVYLSTDETVRFTVTPRSIDNVLNYFEDQIEGRALDGSEPRGQLARRGPDHEWITIWEVALINDVAPVSALVTNSADYVVTFDNWHSVGYGDDVVVIYGSGGEVVRSFRLTDLLSEDHLISLPHSVSSIWWGGEHHFSADETQLILKVVAPGAGIQAETREYLDLAVNLSDGSIVERRASDWAGVEQSARHISEERQAAEREREEAFVRPLLAPIDGTVTDWHQYLNEAFNRVDPDWPYSSASTTVFYPPDHERHEQSIGWARENLHDMHFEGDSMMFASPSQTALADILIELAGEIAPDDLDGVQIYVAADNEHSESIEAAFQYTGAQYVQLDPAREIEQRPERMTAEGRARAAEQMMEAIMGELDAMVDEVAHEE